MKPASTSIVSTDATTNTGAITTAGFTRVALISESPTGQPASAAPTKSLRRRARKPKVSARMRMIT